MSYGDRVTRLVRVAGSTALILLVVLGPPLGIYWLQADTTASDSLSVQPEPLVVGVASVVDERETLVNLRPIWSQPSSVLSPGWSGRVTAVHLMPGSRIADGDPIVSVDGVERRYAWGDAPIARSLARGVRGPDVERLQEVLSRWGYYSGEADGYFGWSLDQSVREFQQAIGQTNADGRFDPAALVWGPDREFFVATIDVVLGGRAPGLGEPVVSGPRRLTDVEILDLVGQPIEIPAAEAWIIEVEDSAIVEVAQGRILAEGIGELEAILDQESEVVEATLRLREPVGVDLVPSGSIVTDSSGRLCLWVPSGDTFVALPVEPLGGAPSAVQIAHGLAQEVLANPLEVIGDLECPAG